MLKGSHHSIKTRCKLSRAQSRRLGVYRQSKETRLKISRALRGKIQSEDHRRNNSKAHKGKIPWNKNKILSKEYRQKLNAYERKTRKRLKHQGWTVLHGGWPDFICEKKGRVMFVEAKSPKAALRPNQIKVHQILKQFGIKVKVMR